MEGVGEGFLTFGLEECPFLDVGFGSGILRQRLRPLDSVGNCTAVVRDETARSAQPIELTLQSGPPSFPFVRVQAFVKENAARGSPVFEDRNLTKPLRLAPGERFRILSPSEVFFTVDSSSGHLRVGQPIDFEQVSTLSGLGTTFQNSEWRLLLSSTQPDNDKFSVFEVVVLVENVNTKAPIFAPIPQFTVSLPAPKCECLACLSPSLQPSSSARSVPPTPTATPSSTPSGTRARPALCPWKSTATPALYA